MTEFLFSVPILSSWLGMPEGQWSNAEVITKKNGHSILGGEGGKITPVIVTWWPSDLGWWIGAREEGSIEDWKGRVRPISIRI